MYALDILLESTGANLCEDVEATNIGIEPNMEGILQIYNESCEEMHVIDKGILEASAQCLQEGASVESLQEAVSGKKVVDKIKAVIQKMWAKIKEFFNKFKLYMSKLFEGNKAFADKYKEEIGKINSVTIQGQAIDASVDIGGLAEKAMGVVEHNSKGGSDLIKNEISKALVGVEAAKFNQGAKKLLGYAPNKVDVHYSGSLILKLLTQENETKNKISTLQGKIDTVYKKAISGLEKSATAHGDIAKENPEDKEAKNISTNHSNIANGYKVALDFINKLCGFATRAITDNAKQAKMAAYKGISESRGKKPEK